MKLVALRCPECGQTLAPENDHIVVACERCHTAVHLGDEGLTQTPVHYVVPRSEAQVTGWLPFWVFHGHVHIKRRVTQGGRSALTTASSLWGQPRDLYVPAWGLSLSKAQEIGGYLIKRQPAFQPAPQPDAVRLTPVTLTTKDALEMLEFIVLAIEARRPDWLKSLDFHLEMDEPALWALPAEDSAVSPIP